MAKIFHAHLHGDRVIKYDRLLHSTISDTVWSEISPQTPFYFLIPQDTQLLKEYDQGWKITEIMPANSAGVITARDALTIHWTEEDIWQTVNDCNYSGWSAGKIGVSIKTSLRASRTGIPCLRRVEI
jgi:hypothetical protein